MRKRYPQTYLFDRSKSNFELKKQLFSDVTNLTIVTPSHWLADLVQQSFLGPYPVKVIPHGIDLGVFQPIDGSAMRSALGISPNMFVLLGVAPSFKLKGKGFQYFLELSTTIEPDAVIVLVGASPKQMKALPSNIIGLERTENVQQLVAYYSMADVFVNPTLEETFSLVTAEALACGTPVVAFDAGALPELVVDGCGIVVPIGDVGEMHRAVLAIKQMGKSTYAENCVSRAERKYDKHRQYRQYIDLYESVLK